MDRLNDPVWQAFEQEPTPGRPPMTEAQLASRQRGLEDMRKGLFVNVEEEVAKLTAAQ
jgi:hypothetical protein